MALETTLKRSGARYQINPGDGAFYGPKIALFIKDAIGRPWQISTIQFDFKLT
jgi:threonyl-tRNA synthetase